MLKKVTLFAGSMLLCSLAFAQANRSANVQPSATAVKSFGASSSKLLVATCADTLNTAILQDTLINYTVTGNGGNVAGNNTYGDKAKADRFSSTGTTYVNGMAALFSLAVFTDPNASFTMNVWDATGTGGTPGASIASKTVTISSIATAVTDGDFVYALFDEPVAVTGTYYLGITLPPGTHTAANRVALYTTQEGDAPAEQAWEQWSSNAWHPYSSTSAWELQIGHAIFPIVSPLRASFTGPATLNLATGNSATFTSTAAGGTTHNWTFQDGTPATSTAANPTVTFSSTGNKTISLTYTDAAGCSETFTRTLNVTGSVGISTELASSVSVYPNPSTGHFNIDMPGLKANQVVITNAIGQVVKQINVSAEQLSVDVSNFANGMYYVQILTNDGSLTKKVSVLH